MASMEELLRYLESFMHGQINQGQQSQGQPPHAGGPPAGVPAGEMQGGVARAETPSGGGGVEPGVMQGGVATNPVAQPPSELAGATPEEVQQALAQFTELHPELAPYLALAGNQPLDLAGAVGQLGGLPAEALGAYQPAFGSGEGSGEGTGQHEFSARIAEPAGTGSGFSPTPDVAPSPGVTAPAAPVDAAAGGGIGTTIGDFFTGAGDAVAGAAQTVGNVVGAVTPVEPASQAMSLDNPISGPAPVPMPYPNIASSADVPPTVGDPGFTLAGGNPSGTLGDPGFTLPSGGAVTPGLGDSGFTVPAEGVPDSGLGDMFSGLPTTEAGFDALYYPNVVASTLASDLGADAVTAQDVGMLAGQVGYGAEQVGSEALGAVFPGAFEDSPLTVPEGSMPDLGGMFAGGFGAGTGAPAPSVPSAPSAPSPVTAPTPDTGPVGGSGIPGDPTGGGDGQFSGSSSITVEPTFVEGDPIGGDDQPAMTISGGGPAIDDGATAGVSDGLADGASSVGDDLGGGIDLSGVSDVVGDVASSGVPLGAAAGAAYDLAEGNYTGAAEEGVIGGLDVGATALGVPGFDSDISVLNDLVDGNTGAIAGDAETAAIATGAGIIGGAAGSVLGPVGTVAGAAIGSFVGQAVAPAVKDAVSDTYDTGKDVFDDTTTSLSDAGTALEQGNVVGAVGDVASGAVEDVGDVATGTADLVGDAAEGVGDVASAVGGVADDIGSGVEDVADDIGDIF
jgi:hypothetical protein